MQRNLLNRIDQRTQLAGNNRLALLLFRLGGRQLFGINVFKVQEVLQRPRLFAMPQAPVQIAGFADFRGHSVPVLDLAHAIGHPEADQAAAQYLVVTEFNRSVQGFLVSQVERIVDIAVQDITPPPDLGTQTGFLTAITRYQNELIQILDVERVLADIQGGGPAALTIGRPDAETSEAGADHNAAPRRVLVVDDSRVARQQIQRVLEHLRLDATVLTDGRQALDHLKAMADRGESPAQRYAMVISDIEMPAMDGYTLTTEIRRDPRLADLYVLLHTSLSGVFNAAMVKRVGANAFVAKYSPDELAERVIGRMAEWATAA